MRRRWKLRVVRLMGEMVDCGGKGKRMGEREEGRKGGHTVSSMWPRFRLLRRSHRI